MIRSLIDIGRSIRDLYPIPLVEVPYQVGKIKKEPKVLVVEVISEPEFAISDFSLLKYSSDDVVKKYFFRTPPASQGPAASLSFKLPGKLTALKQRLEILNILGYKADTSQLSKAISEEIEELKKRGDIEKNVSVLIVLKIDGKWPSENERLRENFINNFLEKLGNYGNKQVWKTQGICHGCGVEKIIYGGVGNLLKFYTVDKHGYAPELNPRIAWKQYALCEDCIFDLERGKRAIDDFLTWRFYGKDFWLLPVSTGNLRKVLDNFRNFHKETSGKASKKGYEILEDKLLTTASRQEEALSYHFVFTKKDNQALRIKLHIEEILPSVLARYIEVKNEVENEFKDLLSESNVPANDMHFNFLTSQNLKSNKQKPGFNEEDFYMLVDKVFRQSPVDEDYLISKAMSRISKDMAEMGEKTGIPRTAILETLLTLIFLLKWGILKRKIGGVEMTSYNEFFDTHGDFFNHPAKRGLVLLGALVQKFLNFQYKQRGSTPFIKVLKNLRLDQKDVQSLFVALQNKMNEYDIGYWWPELRKGVSLNFIEAGDKWPLSPDEIGFYIAVGMALYSHPAFSDTQEDQGGAG